ncbi:hypothetical protein ACQP2U_32530 [Nocardia sp. CA-084685]|uniref:hypothetical protein n=1 Tax=Nocardia sp. CA-084685 TaxID=3239970 RepID=UPI003D98089A
MIDGDLAQLRATHSQSRGGGTDSPSADTQYDWLNRCRPCDTTIRQYFRPPGIQTIHGATDHPRHKSEAASGDTGQNANRHQFLNQQTILLEIESVWITKNFVTQAVMPIDPGD